MQSFIYYKENQNYFCQITVILTFVFSFVESATSTQTNCLNSASEIVQNLPKVWKILTELLSQQSEALHGISNDKFGEDSNPCYKSIETPGGTRLVLSVSKTFIRLKV